MTRPPTEFEARLLKTLLSRPFPGRDQLLAQAATAWVDDSADPDASFLEFSVDPSLPGAEALFRIPVEATGWDKDGMPIHFLLHVNDEGRLSVVEFFREDNQSVRTLPDPESLELLVYPIQG